MISNQTMILIDRRAGDSDVDTGSQYAKPVPCVL